jgi:rhodanese-related sulfurtransferase
VRPASQFERFRIADSLNIPAPFVKTKSFLKDQAFALVNEGRDSSSLEERCKELRASGFKHATVLRGGINGWRRAGGAVSGDLIAQRELTRMRPAEYAVERAYPDWLVVTVADVSRKDIFQLLPDAVPVSLRKDDRRLPADIQAQLAKRKRKGGDLRVLIVDRDGASYDRLEPVLTAGLKQEFYFLDGGFEGYKRFWSEQAAVWAAAARPQRPPGCRT